MNPKLEVNSHLIGIGSTRDVIVVAGFKNLGSFQKIALKRFFGRWGGERKCMWIKNPEITFFDDFHTRSRGSDPTAASPDAIFGTSVYVLFREDYVVHLHVQLFGSITYARGLANDFRRNAFEQFGACLTSEPTLIPRYTNDLRGGRDSLICGWHDQNAYLLCELKRTGRNCYIHAGSGRWPSSLDTSLTRQAASLDDVSDTSFFTGFFPA